MFKFIQKWKARKELKRKQEFMKDIKRGKAVLEMIDNHLVRTGQNRKQRKQFWDEFVKSQNVRNHIYAIMEKSLEGETKYKKEV